MAFVKKKGSEFYASTVNDGRQSEPKVEGLPGGGYVVVWETNTQFDIKAQLFDSAGAPVGGEIAITASATFQTDPEVVVLSSGEFVVAWNTWAQSQPFLSGQSIVGQRYAANGTPLGGQFTIVPPGPQSFSSVGQPSLFALPNGGFVAMWQGEDTWARIYDSAAAPVGSDILIDADSFNVPPAGAAVGSDRFVIFWQDLVPFANGTDRATKGQVFDLAGNKIGGEANLGDSILPAVAALADGGYVVSAETRMTIGASQPRIITAQRFDSNGAAVGPQLIVSDAVANSSVRGPDIVALPWGGFLISWFDNTGGSARLRGQLFDGGGNKLGGAFQINTVAMTDDFEGVERHDLAVLASGEVIAVWKNDNDASSAQLGIKAQHLQMPVAGTALGETLAGTAEDDAILGMGGNDFLLLQDGGEDLALGGDGNDVIYFGSALSAGDVADGGAGRDAIVLQGNVTAVLSETNLAGIESISIQSGANTRFGDIANNFYDFDITLADGNVAAGQQLIVNAQSLRAGEDFTFDGSAESDGRLLVYGGHGTDSLTGGDGVDVFFFEGQRWGPDDRVDGGAGRDSVVISAGSGITHIEFAADDLTSIESISVNNRYATDPSQKPSYELVLHNANVAPGATLIVNGFSLVDPTQTVRFDGSGVHAGNLTLLGGAGRDTLIGGGGADTLYGAGLRDLLTGGGGADVFQYRSTSDSDPGETDSISDFQAGLDKIDLAQIDSDTTQAGDQAFTFIGGAQFGHHAGELRVVDMGQNMWVAMADTNGDAMPDLWIAVTRTDASPMVVTDFLL